MDQDRGGQGSTLGCNAIGEGGGGGVRHTGHRPLVSFAFVSQHVSLVSSYYIPSVITLGFLIIIPDLETNNWYIRSSDGLRYLRS